MQINKKMFTTALTALLLLSIVAIAVPANAFDATSVISLSAASGAVGSSVTVTGPGVGSPQGANPFGSVKVYWDNLGTLLNGTTFAAADGSFSAMIKIPAGVQGTHYVIVQDSLGTQASAVFTVTPSLSAGTGTVRALPGDALTLTGNGYAASSAVTIVFDSTTLGTPVSITLTTPTVTTGANGSFVASITVPATITTAQFDTYTITATDAAANTATASVIVNYYIVATPSTAPPGVTTTISGRIPASKAFIVSIDAVTIFTGTSDATGRFSQAYLIPTLIGIGAHTLSVTWDVINTASNTLTVTTPPTVALSAASGVPLALVTVTGAGFVADSNVTLTFGTTVVNSTAADSRFGPTDATGALSAEFSVPNLAPGAYIVTVTDQFGAAASVVGGFLITAAPVTTVSTATTFAQGDTIGFTITTTDTAVNSVGVYIKDPTGVYWYGSPTTPITWFSTLASPTTAVVLFSDQLANGLHLTLPANAPTGIWNWTVVLPPASTSLPLVRTGLFTVEEFGATGGVTNAQLNSTLTTMNSALGTMNSTLNGLTTSATALDGKVVALDGKVVALDGKVVALDGKVVALDGKVVALDGKVTSITGSIATITSGLTTVTASVNSLSASITSVNGGVATINTKLGDVTTSLTSIDAVLGVVAGDTATLKTSVGTVTTSLASIGTTVTGISGNTATIQTDLGTLKGTVTSVSGNVATIQTSLGTMQADISALQTDVTSVKDSTGSLSTLIIVAIVLALLAAIAAIASIVLMRRKIAG